jgi:hypothetical protein
MERLRDPAHRSQVFVVAALGCCSSWLSQPAGILVVMPTAVLRPNREPVGEIAAVLDRLRGDTECRPVVDAGLAGGLRAWLEDEVVDLARSVPDGASVLVGPRGLVVGSGSPAVSTAPTVALARGAMVGALFRQVVVTGRIEHAMADATAALAVAGTDGAILAFVDRLPPADRAALAMDVRRQARTMAAQWSKVPAAWSPRTGELVGAPLAGGRVVLHGRLDLVLGGPSEGRASVCLVDVRSGERRADDGTERGFHALLETLRSGAQPFRAATYYPASGEIDIEDVTESRLATAVEAVVHDLATARDAADRPDRPGAIRSGAIDAGPSAVEPSAAAA